jgi:ribosomal protein L16 Arg81 hydroxylase
MINQRYTFPWMIDPIEPDHFFEEYWEKKPLLIKREIPDYFEGLLTLEDIDRVITTLNLRYPDINLTSATDDIKAEEFTLRDDVVDPAKVYELFAKGATVILPQLHDRVPTLAELCKQMEREISQPFQTNIYMTPANAQGFKKHWDTHCVFVMQVAGSKNWKIYNCPLENPVRGQYWDEELYKDQIGELSMDFVLEPGDMIYVPRGWVHEAPSRDEVSLHITFGALTWTWIDLLSEAITETAMHHPEFRAGLPIGFAREEFDRQPAQDKFRALFDRLKEVADFDDVMDYYTDQLISFHSPVLSGQMTQLAKLDTLTPDSRAGVRPTALYRFKKSNGSLEIGAFNKTITLPAHAEPAVRFALENDEYRVGDLPELDDEGRLTLVKRLVREGLVQVL